MYVCLGLNIRYICAFSDSFFGKALTSLVRRSFDDVFSPQCLESAASEISRKVTWFIHHDEDGTFVKQIDFGP